MVCSKPRHQDPAGARAGARACLAHSSSSIGIVVPFVALFIIFGMSAFYQRAPLRIKKLSSNAILPTRGSDMAAGLDLCAAQNLTIAAGERALVPTDLSIACPPGSYARIAPRSGLAYKKGIDVGAGVIDADYRGPVGVILFNFGKEDFVIEQGDRIAQLILEQIILPDPIVEVEDLDATERGVGGFGSTGVKKLKTDEGASEEKKQDEE